jgi:hypothetical protein
MDRYQRVEKPKADAPINENEIRITTQGRMRNYITYATTLFQVSNYLINPFLLHNSLLIKVEVDWMDRINARLKIVFQIFSSTKLCSTCLRFEF